MPRYTDLIVFLLWKDVAGWTSTTSSRSVHATQRFFQFQHDRTTALWASQTNEDDPSQLPSPSQQHLNEMNNHTRTALHKMRVSKAQADIDKILQVPDAPMDIEASIQKGVIKSIAPEVVPDTPEDEHIRSLQADLFRSLKRDDFRKASELQKQIQHEHVDDCGAVLQVNHQFYQAFSEKNLDKMRRIWIKDPTATCIHPQSSPIVGIKNVLNGFERMFGATDQSFQKNWFEVQNIRLTIKGASTAIITCDEHVKVRRFVRGKKRETETLSILQATNVFVKVDDKWRLTHHHASRNPDSPGASGIALGSDGFLGSEQVGPLLGEAGKKEDSKKPKRIILGSLNDIFNGSLGDILDGSGTDDIDNEDGNDDESGITLSFSEVVGDGNEDDEDGDDEDDDRDEEGTTSIGNRILKQLRKPDKVQPKSGSVAANNGDKLRQDCISQLRHLAKQGSISPKQKRTLLTDIIMSSAKGEYSMVEVAYELLCQELQDNDEDAEEEFAEQCRVFADRDF